MQEIETMHLTKRYKKLTAVNNLDLTVFKGELFALLGVNGSGKTTTVKMLACLTKSTEGEARVGGFSIAKESKRIKKIIGVSPQKTAIAPNLSVKENLELFCGIHGLSRKMREEKIEEITRQFNLDTVIKRKAGKLSGGWQRRLSIALALINEPDILFLDEPTLGIDVIARRELWDLIISLKGKTTIILTTHYMEEAEMLSDRIGIMKDGNIIAIGTGEELKKRANVNDFEKAFVCIVRGDKICG